MFSETSFTSDPSPPEQGVEEDLLYDYGYVCVSFCISSLRFFSVCMHVLSKCPVMTLSSESVQYSLQTSPNRLQKSSSFYPPLFMLFILLFIVHSLCCLQEPLNSPWDERDDMTSLIPYWSSSSEWTACGLTNASVNHSNTHIHTETQTHLWEVILRKTFLPDCSLSLWRKWQLYYV